jgi:hypothetical protein
MKNLFILSALLLILTSCSKYQINVISSNNITKDPETGKFTDENDSVKITYSFFGRNAPINLDVYNKLNEPLYIDWQRSAFITNDKAVSYDNDNVRITGGVSGTSVGDKNISFSSGNIDATAALPKNVVFIPPHTHVSNTLLEATNQFINAEFYGVTKKSEIPSANFFGTSPVKIGEFTSETSPLNFNSYLTLYTLNGNIPQYTAYKHGFFISKVISTNDGPENFDFYQHQRGDFFYTTKTTTYGKVAPGVGLTALLIGAAAINANQHGGK